MLQIDKNKDVPLTRRIYDAVCEAVLAGRAQPGQKLPARAALAKELGVSMAAVRDAYRALEQQRIVAGRRGDGTYIRPEAVRQVRANVGRQRQIETLVVVLDKPSLAHLPPQAAYIVVDILAGVRDLLSEWETRVVFADSAQRGWLSDLDERSAVLFRSSRDIDPTLVHELRARGIPSVSVWNWFGVGLPSVSYDRYQAAALPCQHLIDCGYRRIGYVGNKASPPHTDESKFLAFGGTLHEAGLDVHARYVRESTSPLGHAYRVAQEMVQSGDLPEALFVDSDYKAMEVIAALRDAGLRVPEDIGIASYDDVPEAATFDPPLTTARVPRREIGRRAAQILLDWPEDGEITPSFEMLTADMVVRSSTCINGASAHGTRPSLEERPT